MIVIDRNIGAVYITTCNINGKKYVGKFLYNRVNNWKTYLGSGKLLLADIKKYGKENFTREIISEHKTHDELKKAEEKEIIKRNAVFDSNYYNMKFASMGGDTFSMHPEKEKTRTLKSKNMAGKNNHQFGKKKTKKMINAVKKSNSKKVSIEGKLYNSVYEASRILGISPTTIYFRIKKSMSYKDRYFYVENDD